MKLVREILILSLFQLLCNYFNASAGREDYEGKFSEYLCIVPYHKSGTSMAKSITYKIYADCKYDDVNICKQYIIHNPEGISNFPSNHGKINCAAESTKKRRYAQFIRHPLDMLISGYLYHKSGKEPNWTELFPVVQTQWIPYNSPLVGGNETVAQFYNSHSEEEGLRMELNLTLGSQQGMGKMFKDMQYLHTSEFPLMTVCMATVDEQLVALETFADQWINHKRNIRLGGKAGTKSDPEEKRRILSIASEVLSEVLPEVLINIFPCFSESHSYVYNTLNFISNLPVENSMFSNS